MSTQNTKETMEFNINWKGIAKWTVISGVVVGAYYLGKKHGAAKEAAKHVVAEPVATTTVETSEI